MGETVIVPFPEVVTPFSQKSGSLEHIPQRDLDLPGLSGTGNAAISRACQIRACSSQLCVVESIVGFETNLQATSLGQSEALRKGDVPVVDAWIGHHAPCRIAKVSECRVDETTGVEPLEPVSWGCLDIAVSESIG
jgi:hypothetical protein